MEFRFHLPDTKINMLMIFSLDFDVSHFNYNFSYNT